MVPCKPRECPKVDIPKSIPGGIPDIPGEDLVAYKKIPPVKKQPIDDVRNNAHRLAEKTKSDSKSDNQLIRDTAENAFILAQKVHDSAIQKEKTRVDYEIVKLYEEYKNKLVEANHAIPGLKDCESTDELPDYIKAVYITELHQKIADQTLVHQNNLKDIEKTLFDANTTWKQAKNDFFNAQCAADAQEIKSKLDADLVWRTSLKTEVDNACKA